MSTTSLRAFRIRLYEEHLEEASFLYEQRRALLEDEAISWMSLAAFELRLEAHLDALLLGGDLASELCREHASGGDSGELFAVTSVICRQTLASRLAEILEAVDEQEPERLRAVSDALKHELPDKWRLNCVRALEHGRAQLKPMLATVVGHRRYHSQGALRSAALQTVAERRAAVLWAIGRNRELDAIDVLRADYGSSLAHLAWTAVRAGLRLHDPVALDMLTSAAPDRLVATEVALAAGPTMVDTLLRYLHVNQSDPSVVMALGLLGEPSAIPRLLECLTHPLLAGAAAQALYLITGAPLFEHALIPEAVSREELFEKEWKAYQETGQLPRRGNGEPFGDHTQRLASDEDVWRAWMKSHAFRFSSDLRYRFGQPVTPGVLVDCIRSESFPKAYRSWVADELLVRYGIAMPFEGDMLVGNQLGILAQASTDAERAERQFEPGKWYFAGQAIE